MTYLNESVYGPVHQFTDEAAIRKARTLGCEIMYSNDNVLLLDLDMSEQEARDLLNGRRKMLDSLGFSVPGAYEFLTSRNGNTHVIIYLRRPIELIERIALQAIMGSDWKREILSLAGFHEGQENPILLFRPPTPKDIWQEDAGDITR